jgi:Transcription factor WhiB
MAPGSMTGHAQCAGVPPSKRPSQPRYLATWNPGAGQRARAELERDPYRSDALVALAAGCNPCTVRRARRDLPPVPPDQRRARPYSGDRSVQRHDPPIPDLPEPPDWPRGLCTHASPDQRHIWTSDSYTERCYAARICHTCPIEPDCAAWSLFLPIKPDGQAAVYGGMSVHQRRLARRTLLTEIARAVRG